MSVMVTQHPTSGHRGRPSRSLRSFPMSVGFFRESGIVGLAAYFYFFVRGLIHAREADAMDNAASLVSFERSLGIFHEKQFQSLILDHHWLVTLFNWIYIYGHW